MIALYFIFNLTTNIKSPGLSISDFFCFQNATWFYHMKMFWGMGKQT